MNLRALADRLLARPPRMSRAEWRRQLRRTRRRDERLSHDVGAGGFGVVVPAAWDVTRDDGAGGIFGDSGGGGASDGGGGGGGGDGGGGF